MSSGFGICGHKNQYSSAVKNGKWVEDLIGMDLARNPPKPQTPYTTETREKMIDPKDMPNNAGGGSLKMLTASEIKHKNKNGLPADLLFAHLGAPGPDRFTSVSHLCYTGGKTTGLYRAEELLSMHPPKVLQEVVPVTTLMVRKSKLIAAEEDKVGSYTTTQAGKEGRVQEVPFKIRGGENFSDKDIPNFKRRPLAIA